MTLSSMWTAIDNAQKSRTQSFISCVCRRDGLSPDQVRDLINAEWNPTAKAWREAMGEVRRRVERQHDRAQEVADQGPGLLEPPTFVYRYYNACGVLLYVGITGNPHSRQAAHKRDSTWWPRARRVAYEVFATRAEAQCAELQAIRTEAPEFNIVGSVKVTPCARDSHDRG